MKLLEIEKVNKTYGEKKVLKDVSFGVEEGTVYGLLGPNGAGKTTLIRIINHITAPDEGVVLFGGERLNEGHLSQIGYLPEERGLYKKMKVGEQALFFARLKGLGTKEAYAALRMWFKRFGIESWWEKPVEELSKGMAQKVQFIITVLHRPKLLIFDEPFSGFDPINANLLRDEILRLRDEGSTVIFSTHNMASVEEICDNITLINHGENILSGNVDELRRRFSKDRYELKFRGIGAELSRVLEPMAKELKLTGGSDGLITAKLLVNEDVRLKDVIAAANDAVDLRAVNEEIASMNSIFISTVNGSEKREEEAK